jgi:hypothetical protein
MITKKKSASKIKVVESSGNVFADLGLPRADQELMKAQLLCKSSDSLKRSSHIPLSLRRNRGN